MEQRDKEKLNIREIVDKYISRWPWFAVAVAMAIVVGLFYARMQMDIYEVTASLLVLDPTKGGSMSQTALVSQLNNIGLTTTPSMANDEEKILNSSVLMKKVVWRLQLYTKYTHSEWLKKQDLYTATPLFVHLDSISLVHLQGKMQLKVTNENRKMVITGTYLGENFIIHPNEFPSSYLTPAGKLTLFINHNVSAIYPLEIDINNPARVAKSIAGNSLLTIVSKDADVINLTLQTTNMNKGQDILNVLGDVYNEDYVEQIGKSAKSSAAFLDERLRLLSGELNDVEMNVENYKQTNNLTNIDADAQMYLGKSSGYDTQHSTVINQLNLISYVRDFMKNPVNKSAIVPNLGLTDAGLLNVIQRYNDLIINKEQIAKASSEENPALKAVELQIQTARKAILESVESAYRGLQITNQDLSAQRSIVSSKLREIPRQEREFVEIKRQQQVKESLYLFLLQKREDASLNMAVTAPKGRIINAPDYGQQVAPRTSLILFVALFLGLLVPFLFFYLKDLIHNAIVTRQDVEKLTQIPILGEIDHVTSSDRLIDFNAATSTTSELFRLLRTNLQFVMSNAYQKVVVITSTEQGEGKSLVSANMAAILSMADKKVLLVELDLRRPHLAEYLNINHTQGVSDYLSGKNFDVNKCIQNMTGYPNLFVLLAGDIPSNPNELLMNDKLDRLINYLKDEYDYILIDSAPVGMVSDTFLLNRLVNINLYICRSGYTDKRSLGFVNQIQKEERMANIYLVINDVPMRSHRYYYKNTYGYSFPKES